MEANKNILLIGPRGCGKTMIFRRLRLKTKITAKKTPEIKKDPYIAFYLPCESLFFMRFSDLSEPYVETHKNALILYFNMAVLAEVSSTLSVLPEYFGRVSTNLAVSIGRHLKEEIQTLWEDLRFPPEIIRLDELTEFSGEVMRHIHKSISYGEVVGPRGSTDFISRLVDIVKREVPTLSEKYFIFFLDDYTEERVPLALQEALHPTVVQRSSDLCFKVSAHMFGSIYHSPRPLALDEGRNINVINLGTAYLKLDKRKSEGKILIEILNERFNNNEKYKGTIKEWLGARSYSGGRSLSQALHDSDTRSKAYYHGIETLVDLCTGDYSEMIRLVGEIFEGAGIKPGTPPKRIPPSIQDKAIKRVSRDYLGRIRHIHPDGQKLFDIVSSFGELSRDLLYYHRPVQQGRDSKGQPRKEPYDLLTIYVDDLTRASKSARELWELLQKASIFVNEGLAPSQRTVIADRATLRRIYCPAFKTTLTSSEHLQATKVQFEYLMDKPDEFSAEYLRHQVPEGTYQSTLEDDEIEETPFLIPNGNRGF